jgi:hypothetical protein
MFRKLIPDELKIVADSSRSMPSCSGLKAHIELSRISGFIVCETFKIAPRIHRPGQPTDNIDTAIGMLQTWQVQLPPNLQMQDDFNHPDPSCCILHMAYNQLIVLTTRPILFAAVKRTIAHKMMYGDDPADEPLPGRHILACLAAAERNLRLSQHVLRLNRRMLQAGLHFLFNAALILLLKRMMNSAAITGPDTSNVRGTLSATVDERSQTSIQFAIHVFEEEAKTGTHYPRDCCKILSDLRTLTDRYLASRDQRGYFQMRPDHIHHHAQGLDGSNSGRGLHAPQHPIGHDDAVYVEIMSWLQNPNPQLQNGLLI